MPELKPTCNMLGQDYAQTTFKGFMELMQIKPLTDEELKECGYSEQEILMIKLKGGKTR